MCGKIRMIHLKLLRGQFGHTMYVLYDLYDSP